MKISPYSPNKPLILGDYGLDRPEPKVFPKLTEEELLAMQPASTQELMKMEPGETYVAKRDWKAKEINRSDYATQDDYNAALVGTRSVGPEEYKKHEACRKVRVHSAFYRKDVTPLIINGKTEWNFNGSSVTQQSKDRASDAYLFTQGIKGEDLTEDEKKRIIGLTEYKSEPPVEYEWKEVPWYKAMWMKITGRDVKAEKRD